MLNFHSLTIADREMVQAVTFRAGRRNCNYTFANLVGWQFWFHTEVCVVPPPPLRGTLPNVGGGLPEKSERSTPPNAGGVLLRFTLDGERAYMVCMAGDLPTALVEALMEDSDGHLMLLGLEDPQAQALSVPSDSVGWTCHIEPRRNQYDYIYRRADLASLAGGKLKAKRNHVNKFLSEHPDFEYRPLTTEMFDDCRQLEALWREERGDTNPEYGDTIAAEQRVVENVFAHWDQLDMQGGSIWLDGRMVAFTYGAAVTDDCIDVCVEKADRHIEGLFSVINQQFCDHLPEQFVYVNREEDMGLEGLRKAKLSYHPEILLSYNVVQFN